MVQAQELNGKIHRDEQSVEMNVYGFSSLALQILGTFTATLEFEGSVDGETWNSILLAPPSTGDGVTSTTTTGLFSGSVAGLKKFRVRASAYTNGKAQIFMGNAVSGGGSGSGNGKATIANGADVNAGSTTDAAVVTDANGTLSGKLRGLVKILADVWSDVGNYLGVSLKEGLNFTDDKVTNRPEKTSVTLITTATTTTVLTGSGGISEIRVLGGTLGNVTAYDNTAGSGTAVVPTVTPVQGQVLARNIAVTTGITIVTAAATIVQVTYHN